MGCDLGKRNLSAILQINDRWQKSQAASWTKFFPHAKKRSLVRRFHTEWSDITPNPEGLQNNP